MTVSIGVVKDTFESKMQIIAACIFFQSYSSNVGIYPRMKQWGFKRRIQTNLLELFIRDHSLLLRLKMSLLYLIKLTLEYKGIPQKQFIHTWLKQAEESLKAKGDGRILQLWKVTETVK